MLFRTEKGRFQKRSKLAKERFFSPGLTPQKETKKQSVFNPEYQIGRWISNACGEKTHHLVSQAKLLTGGTRRRQPRKRVVRG